VVTAANTATPITYTNDEYSNGIVFSGSQLTVQHTGIYEIAYSLQIEKTQGGSASEVDIWLKKNGTNIIRTDSILGLNSNSTKQLPMVSIIDSANANDYYEVYFLADSEHVQITAVPATATIPAAPSIITNIKQIGVAVGTTSGTSGSSGSSGTSGGTGSSGLSGSDGTSGSSGTSGGTGSSGSAGSSGTSGTSGTTGTSGSSGTAGTTGTSGTSATSGTSGTTGTSGTSATSGTTGTSGSSGTSGNATTSARAVQTFTSTSGQTTFTVTNGYNLGMVDVFVNGVKFVNGTDFTATDGTTVVMAAGLAAGNIVEIDNLLTAYLPTNALRTITTFTATAGQTAFSVSYTQGLIDVFYNGSCLAQSEYLAINGTSITLVTACQVNDIVVVYAYSYSVGAYSGIGGSGTINTIPKFTASSTIGDSAITDNGTTVTLVSRALAGTSAVFSSSVDGTIINSTSNAFRLNGNNALSLVTLNSQSVIKINAAGFWGTQLVGANDQGLLINNSGYIFFGAVPSSTTYMKYNFNVGTNLNIGFRDTGGGIARLESTNDAVNANIPMEFAASRFNFAAGNVGINTSNPNVASMNQTGILQVEGGIRATSGLLTIFELGTISQNATITQSITYNGLYLITNGGNNSALFMITRAGGSRGCQLVSSTNGNADIVCGTTTEPAGGNYLRLWMSAVGVLSIKNLNAYPGPYSMNPICSQ
jgi:hypothetical protein